MEVFFMGLWTSAGVQWKRQAGKIDTTAWSATNSNMATLFWSFQIHCPCFPCHHCQEKLAGVGDGTEEKSTGCLEVSAFMRLSFATSATLGQSISLYWDSLLVPQASSNPFKKIKKGASLPVKLYDQIFSTCQNDGQQGSATKPLNSCHLQSLDLEVALIRYFTAARLFKSEDVPESSENFKIPEKQTLTQKSWVWIGDWITSSIFSWCVKIFSLFFFVSIDKFWIWPRFCDSEYEL